MKSIPALLLTAALLLALFAGCQKNDSGDATNANGTAAVDLGDDVYGLPDGDFTRPDGDFIEINEKIFINQINDVYLNADKYLGTTFQYEGIYKNYTWEEKDTTFHYVIRYGPGCCGTDGDAGFEVAWDGDWPETNDWVEAVGVLEYYELDGLRFLQLRLDSLTVKEERGQEYVMQ